MVDSNGDVTAWTDKSGNGNDVNIISSTDLGLFDGSDSSNTELYLNGQPLITGTSNSRIELGPNLSVGPTHTVFNLCKYRNSANNKDRIIQANIEGVGQAFFGFWKFS